MRKSRNTAIFITLATIFLATALQAQEMPKMVTIPPGTFMMGSDRGGHDADESPVHEVTISRVFRMSETEITNLQYEQFRPEYQKSLVPEYFNGP